LLEQRYIEQLITHRKRRFCYWL